MELGLANLLKAGESGLGYVQSASVPLARIKTACRMGSAFSYTSDWSRKTLKRVDLAFGPPDFAALALDTLELTRSLRLPEIQVAKVRELALSILKDSCELLQWLAEYSFITLEYPVLRRLEGVALLSDLTNASARLWEDLGATPPEDRDLFVSISKVLKVSLLLYAYVADDQGVKVVAKGIGIARDYYKLYHKRQTLDPRNWKFTQDQLSQIISSIAIASLAYYAFEKGYIPENLT